MEKKHKQEKKVRMTKVCPRCHGTGVVNDDKDLGRILKQMRLKLGKGRTGISRHMRISEGNLSDMEQGIKPWNNDTVVKFLEAIIDKI